MTSKAGFLMLPCRLSNIFNKLYGRFCFSKYQRTVYVSFSMLAFLSFDLDGFFFFGSFAYFFYFYFGYFGFLPALPFPAFFYLLLLTRFEAFLVSPVTSSYFWLSVSELESIFNLYSNTKFKFIIISNQSSQYWHYFINHPSALNANLLD